MTNSGVLMDEEGRKKGGITDGLIRLRCVHTIVSVLLGVVVRRVVLIMTSCFFVSLSKKHSLVYTGDQHT